MRWTPIKEGNGLLVVAGNFCKKGIRLTCILKTKGTWNCPSTHDQETGKTFCGEAVSGPIESIHHFAADIDALNE